MTHSHLLVSQLIELTCMPGWAIVAQMSSGQQRFPAYVSGRRKAAAGTHNVQARIRTSRDAPGQAARYA
jgi:hypothetical protein